MGDKSFDYELTLEQRRALILGELIRLPELVSMIIGFTRDKEFEDARKERLTLHPMPCAPGFSQPAAWWIMKFHVCIDIRCFHPGFMMLFVPPQYNRKMLHHIYNSNISLLKKLEKGIPLTERENKEVLSIPSTLMICYLNGFEDAKQKLIDSKTHFKQFENIKVYTEFKEVMRVLRKMKYN